MIGLNNKKIVGETCNLIMADHIQRIETISQVLFIMALFKYRPMEESQDGEPSPDLLFMEKCSSLIKQEPVLSPPVAPKLLWTMFALDYGHSDRDLLLKLM